MKTKLLVILICVVVNLAAPSPSSPDIECTCPKCREVLPTYAICLIGISMTIMFFVIVFLGMKIRMKNGDNYNALTSRNSLMINPTEVKIESTNNTKKTKNNSSNEDVNHVTCEKCTVMKVNAVTQTIPVSSEIDAVTKNTNTARALGVKLPVIRPEEMKKICQDVLSKCKYAKSESIAEFSEIKDDKLDLPIVDERKKSLSTSVLDIYDVLPPRTESAENDEIYDELTSKPNDVMVDLDTNYLIPFSKNLDDKTYVNANDVKVNTNLQ